MPFATFSLCRRFPQIPQIIGLWKRNIFVPAPERLNRKCVQRHHKLSNIFFSLQERLLHITPDEALNTLLDIYPDYSENPSLITFLNSRIRDHGCLLNMTTCLSLLRQWVCGAETAFLSRWRNTNLKGEISNASEATIITHSPYLATPHRSLDDLRELGRSSRLLLSSMEETIIITVLSHWEMCGKRIIDELRSPNKQKEVLPLSLQEREAFEYRAFRWLECGTLLMALLCQSSIEAAAEIESFVVGTIICPLVSNGIASSLLECPVRSFSCSIPLLSGPSSLSCHPHVISENLTDWGNIQEKDRCFSSECECSLESVRWKTLSMNQNSKRIEENSWSRSSFVRAVDHLRMWSLLYFRCHYFIPFYLWPYLKDKFVLALKRYTSVLTSLREHLTVSLSLRRMTEEGEEADKAMGMFPMCSSFSPTLERTEGEENIIVALACSEVLLCDLIPSSIHASSPPEQCITKVITKFRVTVGMELVHMIEFYLWDAPQEGSGKKNILSGQYKKESYCGALRAPPTSSYPSSTARLSPTFSSLHSLNCFSSVVNILHVIVFQLVTSFSDSHNRHHCDHHGFSTTNSFYHQQFHAHQQLLMRFLQLWCTQHPEQSTHCNALSCFSDEVLMSPLSRPSRNTSSSCKNVSLMIQIQWLRLFPRLADIMEVVSYLENLMLSDKTMNSTTNHFFETSASEGKEDLQDKKCIERNSHSSCASSSTLNSPGFNPLRFAELVEIGKLKVLGWGTFLLRCSTMRGEDDEDSRKEKEMGFCATGGTKVGETQERGVLADGSREMHVFLFSFWRCWEEWIANMSAITMGKLHVLIKPFMDECRCYGMKDKRNAMERFTELVRLRQSKIRTCDFSPVESRKTPSKSPILIPGVIVGGWLATIWRRTWQRSHHLVLHHQEVMAVISVLGNHAERERAPQEINSTTLNGEMFPLGHQNFFRIPPYLMEDVFLNLCLGQLQETLKHPESETLSKCGSWLPTGLRRVMCGEHGKGNKQGWGSSGYRVQDAAAKAISSLDPFLFADLAPFLWSLLFRMEVRRGASISGNSLSSGEPDSLNSCLRSPVLRQAYYEILEVWLFTLPSSMALEGLQYSRRQEHRVVEYGRASRVGFRIARTARTEENARACEHPEGLQGLTDDVSTSNLDGPVEASPLSSFPSGFLEDSQERGCSTGVEGQPPLAVILALGDQPVAPAALPSTSGLMKSLYIWGTLAHVFSHSLTTSSTFLHSNPVIQPCVSVLPLDRHSWPDRCWIFELTTLVLSARLWVSSLCSAVLPPSVGEEACMKGCRRRRDALRCTGRRRQKTDVEAFGFVVNRVDREEARVAKVFQVLYRHVCGKVEEWIEMVKQEKDEVINRRRMNNKHRTYGQNFSIFSISNTFLPSTSRPFSGKDMTTEEEVKVEDEGEFTPSHAPSIDTMMSPRHLFYQVASTSFSLFDLKMLDIVQEWWVEYCFLQRELSQVPKDSLFRFSSSTGCSSPFSILLPFFSSTTFFSSGAVCTPPMAPNVAFHLLHLLTCVRPAEAWASIPHAFLCHEWEMLAKSILHSSDSFTGSMSRKKDSVERSDEVRNKPVPALHRKQFEAQLCCSVVVEELALVHRFLVWSEFLHTLCMWMASVLHYYRGENGGRKRRGTPSNSTTEMGLRKNFSYSFCSPLLLLEYWHSTRGMRDAERVEGGKSSTTERATRSPHVLHGDKAIRKNLPHFSKGRDDDEVFFPSDLTPPPSVLEAYGLFQHGIQPRNVGVSLVSSRTWKDLPVNAAIPLWPLIMKRESALASIIRKFYQ